MVLWITYYFNRERDGKPSLYFFMNEFIIKVFLIFFPIIFIISCSSSQETKIETKEEKDTTFVFDEIPPEDLFEFETPAPKSVEQFVIQIGAFSTFERAKDFADQSWVKLNKEIKVEYKQTKNLYVVWIYPPFTDKILAENFRKKIQQGGEFSDAWIVKIDAKK